MSENVIELTDNNFKVEVQDSQVPVLVDFWAPWCAPCRAIAPHIEAVANEYVDKAKVGKVNVDNEQTTAGTYGVRSIPTILLFKNGQPVEQIVGSTSKENLAQILDKHL